jgi:type IV pilus assembly protein PilV
MKSRKPIRAGKFSRGFSMLEVLISVLLVSTVLLSLALLQVISLRGSNSSYQRTASVVLANDIADKIRANQVAAANYAIAVGTAAAVTPATRAQWDVRQWKDALAAALPNGDGSIVYDAANRVATVTIEWQDRQADQDYATTNDNANTQYIVRSSL